MLKWKKKENKISLTENYRIVWCLRFLNRNIISPKIFSYFFAPYIIYRIPSLHMWKIFSYSRRKKHTYLFLFAASLPSKIDLQLHQKYMICLNAIKRKIMFSYVRIWFLFSNKKKEFISSDGWLLQYTIYHRHAAQKMKIFAAFLKDYIKYKGL